MKKSHYLVAAVLGLLITTAVVGATSLASPASNSDSDLVAEMARFKIIHQAMIDGDYDSWSGAMEDVVSFYRQTLDEMEAQITEETFESLLEVYELIQEGRIEEAKALMEELDLTGFGPKFKGLRLGFKMFPHLGHKK